MKAASKYAFVSKKKAAVASNLDRRSRAVEELDVREEAPAHLFDDFAAEQPDTNVISVHFDTLTFWGENKSILISSKFQFLDHYFF